MKKILVLVCAMFSFTSCMTIKNSATYKTVDVQPISVLTADLQVSSKRISYTMRPHRRVQRGGFENVKSTAIREALQKNGGGDILVGLEVQTTSKSFLFWNKVASITVSGYPAKYVNFHSPDKSYWTPVGLWLTQDAIQKSKNPRNSTQLKDILELVK